MNHEAKTITVFLAVILAFLFSGTMIPFLEKVKSEEAAETIGEEQATKRVALTFDDGPGKYTEKLLDGLRERDVHASFFVIGENAQSHKDLIARMKEEGHIIGNHTFSHVQLTSLSQKNANSEVCKTNVLLQEITGKETKFIRPPYGLWNKNTKCMEEMTVVLWNVDPRDWSVQNTDKVVKHVLSNVKDGSIILLHDIYDTSVEAAFQIIDALKKDGYEFVTVDRMESHEKKGFQVIR